MGLLLMGARSKPVVIGRFCSAYRPAIIVPTYRTHFLDSDNPVQMDYVDHRRPVA